MAIVDQYGNPIERSVLAEPQTSRVSYLKREFARHPSRGLTPQTLASILEQAEAGDLVSQAELFTDMEEKDGHILAEMGKRRRALLTLPWDIVPPNNPNAAETKLAAEVKEWFSARTDLDDLIFDLMDAAGHAYSCVEIEWQRAGREYYPGKLCHRLPSWFQLDRDTRSELRLRTQNADGEKLNPFGWIVHTHKAKSGQLARVGLHRALAWPYLYKNYAVRDLAEFLEVYGLPVRLGKYMPGASDTDKTTLLRAVMEIGHNAAGIIPEGMAIELLEAAEGSNAPFTAQVDWCERTQSKVILGQTLSSEARATGMGSGVAELQSEVRDDLKVSDARQLSGTLRQLIYYWCALNRGLVDPNRAPLFQFDTRTPEDLKTYADSLPKLVDMGMKIPASYAHDRLKIPQAKENEPVLTPAAKPAPAAGIGTEPGARAQLRVVIAPARDEAALHAAAAADQELLDQAATDLATEWEKVLGPRIEELFAFAESTGDLVTLRARLAELMRGAPTAALVDALENSAFVGQLMGRAEER